MSDRVFYRRQFLNTEDQGGIAFVEAEVREAEGKHVDASLTIGDCTRNVTLDFSVYSDDERIANLRQKVQKIRKVIVAFEAALLAQLKEAER